ncbi:MAG: hypothetical protein IJD32_08290 [Bacteroidaceae bacterium]|nr:hypothetical protein [Bacteroidaceae bacterium]
MERLGKVKMDYVKPVVLRVDLDKDLCDVVEIPCGVTGTFTTSKSKYQEYQICVHYPAWQGGRNGKKYVYSKNNGQVRYLRIKGEHDVAFLGPDGTAKDYCNDNIKDGSAGGCGWQQYETSGNGGCHYFGQILIDGHVIGQGTDLYRLFKSEVYEVN